MADLDITKNNMSNTRIKIPGDPGSASISAAQHTESRDNSTLIAALSSAGYTVGQLNAMSKNDMLYAYRMNKGIAPRD